MFLRCAKRRPTVFRFFPASAVLGERLCLAKGKFWHIAGTRANRGLDVCHRSGSKTGGMKYGYARTSSDDQTTELSLFLEGSLNCDQMAVRDHVFFDCPITIEPDFNGAWCVAFFQ